MKCSPFRFIGMVALLLPLSFFAVADTAVITVESNEDIQVLSLPLSYSDDTAYVNLESCFQQLGGLLIAMTDQIEASLGGHTATLIASHREVALPDRSFSLSHPCLFMDNTVSIAAADLELFFQHGYGMSVKVEQEQAAPVEGEFVDLEGDESLLLEVVDDLTLAEESDDLEDEKEDSEEANEGESSEEEPPVAVEEGKAFDFAHLKTRSGTIVLDPAHGGSQGGITPEEALQEKELLLRLGLLVKTVLEENTAVDVILTRSEDAVLSLAKKKATAEKSGASLFVSLEGGCSFCPKQSGFNIWTDQTPQEEGDKAASEKDLNRRSRRRGQAEKAMQYARILQQKLSLEPRVGQVTLRQAPLILQREIDLPVLLIETGYLSNPETVRNLQDETEVEKLAFSLAWAIAESLQ